jgi:hypothetical protein
MPKKFEAHSSVSTATKKATWHKTVENPEKDNNDTLTSNTRMKT